MDKYKMAAIILDENTTVQVDVPKIVIIDMNTIVLGCPVAELYGNSGFYVATLLAIQDSGRNI